MLIWMVLVIAVLALIVSISGYDKDHCVSCQWRNRICANSCDFCLNSDLLPKRVEALEHKDRKFDALWRDYCRAIESKYNRIPDNVSMDIDSAHKKLKALADALGYEIHHIPRKDAHYEAKKKTKKKGK